MDQAAKMPATNMQHVNIGKFFVQKSGLFTQDLQSWDMRPNHQLNWSNFQSHFIDAQHKLELSQTTANTMGLHSANSAKDISETVISRLRHEANTTCDIIPIAAESPPSYYGNPESYSATIIKQRYN